MKQLKITVNNKTYDVTVEVLGETSRQSPAPTSYASAPVAPPTPVAPAAPVAPPVAPLASAPAGAGTAVTSPMAGVCLRVDVTVGQAVQAGQVVVVLEAMKMETPVVANVSGTVSAVLVQNGQAVTDGQPLIQIA
jgi:biotin carboxyl carrier protein